MQVKQIEQHHAGRTGWLRAAVLGANDGILSTASLVMGVAAANGSRSNVLIAGIAGLVAGAMSMAAGEYVSVHSQKDTEDADLALERTELRTDNQGEHKELAAIYVGRGLDPALAKTVADQLMAHDALGAHARDELGITPTLKARPIQAALASAASFMFGAAMPLVVTALAPRRVSCTPSRRRRSWCWRLSGHWRRGRAARGWRRSCGSPSGARSRWASRQMQALCSARLFEIHPGPNCATSY